MLFTSLRYLPEIVTRRSSREEAYGDLKKAKLEPASGCLDDAHQDEEDGKPLRRESALQWQFVLFSFWVGSKNRAWAKTLGYQVPELLLAASELNGAWLCGRMDDFPDVAVQADMEE